MVYMSKCILELQAIHKQYGGRVVLDDIALSVASGECVSLVGENGCGKSTLLRIAAGLTLPDKGRVVRKNAASLQYVPDHFPSLPISGAVFLRTLAKVDCATDPDMIRRFHMDQHLDQSIQSYSKGMLSKLGVLQALCANPGVLLLDEPITGQDADARAAFVGYVRQLMSKGTAVMMASHEQELLDALSTRIVRIRQGKLIPVDRTGCEKGTCLCPDCALLLKGECAGRGRNHA